MVDAGANGPPSTPDVWNGEAGLTNNSPGVSSTDSEICRVVIVVAPATNANVSVCWPAVYELASGLMLTTTCTLAPGSSCPRVLDRLYHEPPVPLTDQAVGSPPTLVTV